jgi:hypothetical protein
MTTSLKATRTAGDIAQELAPVILAKITSRGNRPTVKADVARWLREDRPDWGETASNAMAYLVLRRLKRNGQINGTVEHRAVQN